MRLENVEVLIAKNKSARCHSERSEESPIMIPSDAKQKSEMFRSAQHDKRGNSATD
jgi:hypothetical protein